MDTNGEVTEAPQVEKPTEAEGMLSLYPLVSCIITYHHQVERPSLISSLPDRPNKC